MVYKVCVFVVARALYSLILHLCNVKLHVTQEWLLPHACLHACPGMMELPVRQMTFCIVYFDTKTSPCICVTVWQMGHLHSRDHSPTPLISLFFCCWQCLQARPIDRRVCCCWCDTCRWHCPSSSPFCLLWCVWLWRCSSIYACQHYFLSVCDVMPMCI